MNILLIGPEDWTATDGFILQGVKNILSHTFGEYQYTYIHLLNSNKMNISDFLPDNKYDYLVVCGTPWLWDSFQNSIKWRNLLTAIIAHPESKRILMGIGGCFDLDADDSILKRKEEREALELIYNDSLVFTRDVIAKEKLDSAGIENYLLPCPGYFAASKTETREGNLLVWVDPLETISWMYWKKNKKQYKKLLDLVEEYVTVYKPVIVKANERDSGYKNTPTSSLITRNNAIECFKNYSNILSLRVHCAIPAFTMGKKVGIVPIDSRATAAELGGIKMVANVSHFEEMSEIKRNLTQDLESYKNIILNYEINR